MKNIGIIGDGSRGNRAKIMLFEDCSQDAVRNDNGNIAQSFTRTLCILYIIKKSMYSLYKKNMNFCAICILTKITTYDIMAARGGSWRAALLVKSNIAQIFAPMFVHFVY